MEYFRELYEKDQKNQKELLEIENRLEKLRKKKLDLENKIKNDQETSEYLSRGEDIKTVG